MSDDLFGGLAHARHSDPDTSHEAAEAISEHLRPLQAKVEAYARQQGPRGFTDLQMEEDLEDPGSTYRTRRSELALRNIILDSGHRRMHGESRRQRIVWVHRQYVSNAPPIQPPPAPPQPAVKLEGRDKAKEMRGWARQMHSEGRTAFAAMLNDAADLMESLSV